MKDLLIRKRKPIKKAPDSIDVTIMLELKKYPPSTMRQIGKMISRTHVSVKQRVDWLVENGYVQNAPNVPVGSPRSKVLTQQGFEYLEHARTF